MDEKAAHKALTDAGFTGVFDQPQLANELICYENPGSTYEEGYEPEWVTIETNTYRHKDLPDLYPVIYLTAKWYRHPLPKEVVAKYEKDNAETVTDALNQYNYKVVMRFCT